MAEEAKTKKKKNTEKKEDTAYRDLVVKEIDAVITKMKKDYSEKEIEMLEDALKKVFVKGIPPKEAMGLGDDMINMLYNNATNEYNSGKYKEANSTFKLLTILDPEVIRNFHGLAASYHKMGNFERAIEVYFGCAYLDPLSPIPFYHISDCYIQLKDPVGALLAVNGAINRCGEEPAYEKIKARCQAMMSELKKELGVEEEEKVEEEQEGGIFEQLQEEKQGDSEPTEEKT
ncbi:MAG: Chaperone protein IpgC [Chlamydiae bacterium]|nr:Chaperone protein IpgC [Chlamydiota bacterium]